MTHNRALANFTSGYTKSTWYKTRKHCAYLGEPKLSDSDKQIFQMWKTNYALKLKYFMFPLYLSLLQFYCFMALFQCAIVCLSLFLATVCLLLA